MQHKFEQKEEKKLFPSEALSVPIPQRKYREYYRFCIIENKIGVIYYHITRTNALHT